MSTSKLFTINLKNVPHPKWQLFTKKMCHFARHVTESATSWWTHHLDGRKHCSHSYGIFAVSTDTRLCDKWCSYPKPNFKFPDRSHWRKDIHLWWDSACTTELKPWRSDVSNTERYQSTVHMRIRKKNVSTKPNFKRKLFNKKHPPKTAKLKQQQKMILAVSNCFPQHLLIQKKGWPPQSTLAIGQTRSEFEPWKERNDSTQGLWKHVYIAQDPQVSLKNGGCIYLALPSFLANSVRLGPHLHHLGPPDLFRLES